MKKIGFIIIILAFAFNKTVLGQNLVGCIQDENKNPVEFANVFLLSLSDSSLVAGTYTDNNGFFVFDNLYNQEYILKISCLGFEEICQNIVATDINNNLGAICLSPASKRLEEVVVAAQKLPFRLTGNGLQVQVGGTLLNDLGTAVDVIERLPGIVMEDGKIKIFGKGVPLIYLNNRKIIDNTELERLESSEIETIDMLTNPGAKYDAEGRTVLIIKTKKENGFSAHFTERLRKACYWGDNENLNISFSNNHTNIYASWNHRYGKINVDENHETLLRPDTTWKHKQNMPYMYSTVFQQPTIGFDYNLNKNNVVGAQYQFFTFQLCNPLDIISLSFANDSLFEETFSKSTKESKTSQHLVNAFYRGKINTLYSVQLDFDFLKNINEQTQITQEISNSGNRNLNVLSLTDYSLYAGKLTNSFTGKFGLLEIGSELTRIVGNGYVINTDGYIENNIFSNMETKGALFLNYSHQVCSMDFSAGLRYELSNEKYTEGSMQNTIMDKQYFDCYPSVSLSKQISNAKISISFNKRTQRPNFNQLNGNTVYVNRFLFQKGNPYLKKINIYETDLQATYRTIYLNLGYTYEKDPVTFQLEKQKNKSNAILSTFANFSDYQEIYAIVNFRSKISFWNPNYGFGITKPYFKINDVQYNKANLYFNLYNDFCLPKEFTVSLNFRYRNDYLYYYTENKGYVKLDLSIKKQINNSLRLSLNIYDVFNSVSQMETMKINDIEFKTWKKDETRYVVFSVSYMFNNNIKQYHPSNASGEDLKRF